MAIGTLAAVGLAAAGVGTAIASGNAKSAANKASATQAQTATQNNALAREIYGQNQAALAPYIQTGNRAGATINAFAGLGTHAEQENAAKAFGSFLTNSDYGFQFGQGSNALNSGYAGAGTLQSGAAMKDLESFRQDLQSGYRGNWLNLLTGQQGTGLSAAGALAGVSTNYANNVQQNNQTAADARSNAFLVAGQNNPFANALGMLGGAAFQYGMK